MFDQNLELAPGAQWMLLSHNGKMIMEPNFDGSWTVRFLFASKRDMILDIQEGLSAKRCAGRMDWSIEKHSILVARLMEIMFPEQEWGALGGLFHDDHEAYIGDIPSPVGRMLSRLEDTKKAISKGIREFLDFDFRFPEREIHMCDQIAWDLESAELLRFSPNDPFLIKHAPELVQRKRMGLHKMVKGYIPEIEDVFNNIRAGAYTFESEFRRLTTHS